VIEVTSRTTRREDQGKKSLYERIGTEEYVLFDPFGEYLRPRLQGYRLDGLDGRRFQPVPLEADGSLRSRTTGLTLRPEGWRLRLVDSVTGDPILWHEEVEAALAHETTARRATQERLRLLEEELSRLRQR
jgi:hypothetical protein